MISRIIVGISGASGAKERRRLVIAPRECPLNPIHLKNPCYLADVGLHICPL